MISYGRTISLYSPRVGRLNSCLPLCLAEVRSFYPSTVPVRHGQAETRHDVPRPAASVNFLIMSHSTSVGRALLWH